MVLLHSAVALPKLSLNLVSPINCSRDPSGALVIDVVDCGPIFGLNCDNVFCNEDSDTRLPCPLMFRLVEVAVAATTAAASFSCID